MNVQIEFNPLYISSDQVDNGCRTSISTLPNKPSDSMKNVARIASVSPLSSPVQSRQPSCPRKVVHLAVHGQESLMKMTNPKLEDKHTILSQISFTERPLPQIMALPEL